MYLPQSKVSFYCLAPWEVNPQKTLPADRRLAKWLGGWCSGIISWPGPSPPWDLGISFIKGGGDIRRSLRFHLLLKFEDSFIADVLTRAAM